MPGQRAEALDVLLNGGRELLGRAAHGLEAARGEFLLPSGLCTYFVVSTWMRSTMAFGVPAGATSPYQNEESKFFRPTEAPASENSGTDGMVCVGVVTAYALIRPECTSGVEAPGLSRNSDTWLPIRSG